MSSCWKKERQWIGWRWDQSVAAIAIQVESVTMVSLLYSTGGPIEIEVVLEVITYRHGTA